MARTGSNNGLGWSRDGGWGSGPGVPDMGGDGCFGSVLIGAWILFGGIFFIWGIVGGGSITRGLIVVAFIFLALLAWSARLFLRGSEYRRVPIFVVILGLLPAGIAGFGNVNEGARLDKEEARREEVAEVEAHNSERVNTHLTRIYSGDTEPIVRLVDRDQTLFVVESVTNMETRCYVKLVATGIAEFGDHDYCYSELTYVSDDGIEREFYQCHVLNVGGDGQLKQVDWHDLCNTIHEAGWTVDEDPLVPES